MFHNAPVLHVIGASTFQDIALTMFEPHGREHEQYRNVMHLATLRGGIKYAWVFYCTVCLKQETKS